MRRIAVSSVAALVACAHDSGSPPASDVEVISDPELRAIVEDHWSWTLQQFPELATRLGDHRFDDRLTDVSVEARIGRRKDRRRLLGRLEAISARGLSNRDLVNRELLMLELRGAIAAEPCRFEEWSLSPRGNPITILNYIPQSNLRKTASGATALLARYRAGARKISHVVDNLESGIADGLYANAESTRRVLSMVRSQLEKPVERWPMFTEAEPFAARSELGEKRFRAEVHGVLESMVRPALERYRDLLRDEILPNARGPDDGVGLAGLPFGEQCYEARVRRFLTLELDPQRIHETGLSEIERIDTEMAELGRSVFGTETLKATLARLRASDDPELYFDSREAILNKARSALARAKEAIPPFFGRLPEADCVVREIPEYEAPFTTVAYYRQPVPSGERPGEYYVNTHAPETRTRYEAEALAFHEAIPGHHLQIAISQELPDLPPFRRHLGMTVFVEGWALYAEGLAEEMSLYSSDLDRLGRLSYEAWRAARLVVDTGIHALGWSRERARRFMTEHTALAPNNIDNEVDRYIVWPGQALAYKIGELEIRRLRQRAERQLGAEFNLAAFHDVVLGGGAVSLPVLRGQIESWIRRKRTPPM